MLTNESPPDEVAAAIIAETKRRGYGRDESIACVSTGLQESGLRMVWDSGKRWFGYFQQDGSYPNRFDPMGNILGFLDRLDQKRRSPGASSDPFKTIFWLQQRPSDPSADVAYERGRKAYYDEIRRHIGEATDLYNRHSGQPAPPPPPAPQTYGMPRGSNSGGYGGNGVKFPPWVYTLGNVFGLKPSTYPGHQESNRNEAGYAPNPQNLNRGIDWAAPGAPDEVDRMTRFADYLATIPQHLEQVIWQNPKTMRSIEVAGGRHQPGYFRSDLPGHRNHVHTRQSKPIPLPGGTPTPPAAAPPPARLPSAPQFQQRDMFGKGGSPRSRPPINFFIHTEEGNGSAESLARYCQGQNGVSYHFTLRDRIVYYVVPTNLYSWSVLDANVFSVNLCFAGSRAAFTREQWLQREGDIEVAAYIAVREARHFGFSTEVIPPPYSGAARPGISDHKYVTQKLRIGTHTDVGNNFPWDVFTRYVHKYANPIPQEDDLTPEQDQMLRAIFREQTQRHPSRSALRKPGEGLVDTWAGMDLNTDGNVHLVVQVIKAWLGHPKTLNELREVAANADLQDDRELAQAILAEVAGKPKPTPMVATAAGGVDTSAVVEAVRSAVAEAEPKIIYTAAPEPVQPHETVAQSVPAGSTGQRIGQLVDAVEQMRLSEKLSPQEAATLKAVIGILAPQTEGEKDG